MTKKILCALLLLSGIRSHAQQSTIDQYIAAYKDIAIGEMNRTGIPASITLAQGLLEAQAGNSPLVKMSNNHFGIKCKSNWTGETVSYDDDDTQECFRKYASALDSYRDHSDFLKNSGRYGALFQLGPTDYKAWARGLKKCGYATNPRYAELLIASIEKNNLEQFDTVSTTANMAAPAVSGLMHEKGATQTVAIEDAGMSEQEPAAKNTLSRFNGLKAVLAKKGTSVLALATQNGISLNKLMEFNDLPDEGLLHEDQIVYLEKKNREGRFASLKIESTESLRNLSQALGIQLKSLREFNNIDNVDDLLVSGTTILLKPKG